MKPIPAEYVYKSRTGEVLRKKLRHPGKEFSWQTFDQDAGRWYWGAWGGSATSTLYHLDQLKPGLAFVCEGEKDCDSVMALGLTAVTSGNAGSWRRHHSEQLKQAGVTLAIILPDHDDAGRDHAFDVARENLAVNIPSKIIRLPNLNEHEDVSDFIERGGSRMDLIGLAKCAKLVTQRELPPSPSPSPSKKKTHHDFSKFAPLYREKLKLSATARGQRMVICPFHVDGNPSLSLDLDKAIFFCHGCHVGGSPIDFYMHWKTRIEHQTITRADAWRRLQATYL